MIEWLPERPNESRDPSMPDGAKPQFHLPTETRPPPALFVDTPGGVYVGLSFAEPETRDPSGPPVDDTPEETVAKRYAQPDANRVTCDSASLSPAEPLTWDEYLSIEESLDVILSRKEYSVGRRLTAGHIWLGMLAQMLASGRAEPGRERAEVLRFYVTRTRTERHARAFDIAGRGKPNPTTKRQILGACLDFQERLGKGGGALRSSLRMTVQNLRHWARLGSLRFPPLDVKVPYRRFAPRPDALLDERAQDLLGRWVRHALFRKDIVRHGDMIRSYGFLVLLFGLVGWYQAALEHSGAAEPESLDQALGIVEERYALHPDFATVFLFNPVMTHLLDYLLAQPTFARSIVEG